MSTIPPRIATVVFFWMGTMTIPAKEPVYQMDFARDLDVNRILQEAPVFRQTSWETPRETYFVAEGLKVKERQYVFEVRLPKEGLLKIRSNLSTIMAKDGIVTRLTFNSGIMPLEEAHQAALEISTMMNLKTERIAEWYKKAILLKGPESCLLMTRTYPRLAIEIRSSINTIYPYMLTASITWNDLLGGPSAVPAPFPEPITISLDPPSGKIYDPAEMWGDPVENARQMEQWMRQHPDQADAVRKQIEIQKQKEQAKPSSSSTTIVPPTLPAPSNLWKWLWAAVCALLTAAFLWSRKKHT